MSNSNQAPKRRIVTTQFLKENSKAALKVRIDLNNWVESMHPKDRKSGFALPPVAKCARKKVFLDGTTLASLAKAADFEVPRDAQSKLKTTDHATV